MRILTSLRSSRGSRHVPRAVRQVLDFAHNEPQALLAATTLFLRETGIAAKHFGMSLRVKQTNSRWALAPVFQLLDIRREPGLAPIG